ncbi:MAG: M1 family metallopeptidase, partial [Chloroflexi bacterium]|nr:M1 family metallopeptidase [Chloroflexota bacterium]
MPESNAVMLPASVRPVRYRLTLEPNLSDFTFRGEESVDIEVLDPTSKVVLNSAEIAVQSCRLTLADGSTLTPQSISLDESEETVTFEFDSTIPTGAARLDIEFTGELNDRLHGFYRSAYVDADGNERYMAATQFESTDARRAFPCWDEPALKATFDVTLKIPADLVAISNMPIVSETEEQAGVKVVHFAESPIMSTYLLVFIVGDLKAVEQEADGGTLIRIWAVRGKEEQGRFALETSVRLLTYFNEYFGIPFPLPKLDHLAIPDFAAGAMENWGAITYRETTLLVDPENSSAVTKQLVAAVISHEMAHMWFGDLVTMAWWNDLWLNESFASWMGDKAIDNLFPEWEMWTQFLTADTNTALSLDGLKSSHPIEQEVNNPAEIGELFDAISYSKGGSILRMLETFLGADAFQRGLHQYLTSHEYANARTEDLWNALADASGQPVATIMDTWVKQVGYPVLDVQVDRQDDGIDVSFSQSRFVYEDIVGEQEPDDSLWQVPVSVRTASDAEPVSTLMDESQASTRLTPASTDEWIKVNPLQTGFYRVKYSSDELARLTSPIRDLTLPTNDRLGIQNDAYALAKAGHIPATDFLKLAEAYKNETDASVCSDLASNLGGMDRLLWDTPYYAKFQEYALSIFQPIGRRIGWDAGPDEGHLDALLRSTVLAQLGSYEDKATLNEASRRFEWYADDPAKVRPDIRGLVFTLAAKRGSGSTYETMWDIERKAASQEEKVRLLIALTQFDQPGLLRETLEKSLSDDVRAQDTITMITWSAATRIGR